MFQNSIYDTGNPFLELIVKRKYFTVFERLNIKYDILGGVSVGIIAIFKRLRKPLSFPTLEVFFLLLQRDSEFFFKKFIY